MYLLFDVVYCIYVTYVLYKLVMTNRLEYKWCKNIICWFVYVDS